MSQSGQMSAKGVDDRTREAARAAAAAKGMTLGEYLNQTVRGDASTAEANAKQIQKRLAARQNSAAGVLERLTKRIEAVEARSTLAITTMDEAILSLVSRLETSEDTSSAVAGYVEGLIEEFRKTQTALQTKVSELQTDNASQKNLETLQALEQALGKLASHVFDEHEMAQNEAAAMRGRMEAGFVDLGDRFEDIEISVNQKMAEASESLSQTAGELESLKAQTEARRTELSEQVSAIETRVSEQISDLESKLTSQASATTLLVNDQASVLREETSEQLSGVNSQMASLQDRLQAAETTTDSALQNLQTTYEGLEQRIEGLAGTIDPNLSETLRAEFESRFEELTAAMRETVDQARAQLADEILSAASTHTDQAVADLRLAVEAIDTQSSAGGTGVAEAELTKRLDEMTQGIETRLDALEGQDVDGKIDDLRSEVGEINTNLTKRFDTFTELVDQRITDHEQRNASAIAQMGDQVTAASQRFQQRQDEAFERMNQKIDSNQDQSTTRLSDALANVSDRLEQMQSESATSMSPVQKAIASLASRLELIEDTISPETARDDDLAADRYQDDSAALYEEISQLEDLSIDDLDSDGFEMDPPSLQNDPEADEIALFEEHDPEGSIDDGVGFDEIDTELETDEAAFELQDPDPITEENALEAGDTLTEALHADAVSFLDETETPEQTPEAFETENEADEWFDPNFSGSEDESTSPDILELLSQHDTALETIATSSEEEAPTGSEDAETEDSVTSEETASEPYAFGDEDFADSGSQEIDALLAALQEEAASDPLHPLDDDHTEARDSDVFDDHTDEFIAAEAPILEEAETASEPDRLQDADAEPLVLEPITPVPETAAPAPAQLDEVTSDYITRARQAAIAASAAGKQQRPQISERVGLGLGSTGNSQSRLPIYAAASALAVTGAAVGGFIYMRGKQPPEVVSEPATSDTASVPARAAETMVAAESIPTEEFLFDPIEPLPVPEQPAPSPVETAVTTPELGSGIYPEIPQSTTLQTASDSGNRIAQFVLGQQKVRGGEIRDGVTLIRQSANAGLPIAQYELARLHDSGTGVPKDLGLSRSWTEKAAEGGNVKAMYDLAVFMAEGEGGPRSYTGAAEWFRKAAAHGVVDSQYNLGILYEQGLGISQDSGEALYWFTVAANNGDAGAPSKIVQLSDRVDTSAKAEIDARADRWQPAISPSIANGRFGAQPWDVGNAEQVKGVQAALNALGFDAGPADGVMGSSTAYAIRLYQRTYDLPVTGTVTLELIDSLNATAIPANG